MSPSLIFVTGGAGYIGSHTCKRLRSAGYEPLVVDNLHTGREELVRYGPLIRADVRNVAALRALMLEHKPRAVMHFAALLAVSESVTHPAEYYDVNVQGTWSLLEAMRDTGVEHIIFSSSAAVYGTPLGRHRVTEETLTAPINPYGQTKLIMEYMLRDYSSAYPIRHVALRYFNAAGADIDGEVGYCYPNPTNLVPAAVNVLAGFQPVLKVYGTDYSTPDGTCIRDYIHVVDLADAHVKALQYLFDGGPSTAFNLGTNRGSSVKEVITALEATSGMSLPVEFTSRRKGDPEMLVADATKAMNTLAWSPQYSDLTTITRTAWDWRRRLGVKSGSSVV